MNTPPRDLWTIVIGELAGRWHRVVLYRWDVADGVVDEGVEVVKIDVVLEAPPEARLFVVDQVVAAVRSELLRRLGLGERRN